MTWLRRSAPKAIGTVLVAGLALLLFRVLVGLTWSSPPGEGVVFSPLLLLAQLAALVGAFYLSVGVVLGVRYWLSARQHGWWPRIADVFTPIVISVVSPVISIGLLLPFGFRTGFQYLFSGYPLASLPVTIGLLSKRDRGWRPFGTVGVFIYGLIVVLTYGAGVSIWPISRPDLSLLEVLLYAAALVVPFVLVSGPLYAATLGLNSTLVNEPSKRA